MCPFYLIIKRFFRRLSLKQLFDVFLSPFAYVDLAFENVLARADCALHSFEITDSKHVQVLNLICFSESVVCLEGAFDRSSHVAQFLD